LLEPLSFDIDTSADATAAGAGGEVGAPDPPRKEATSAKAEDVLAIVPGADIAIGSTVPHHDTFFFPSSIKL
jgi:hypothetical protein